MYFLIFFFCSISTIPFHILCSICIFSCFSLSILPFKFYNYKFLCFLFNVSFLRSISSIPFRMFRFNMFLILKFYALNMFPVFLPLLTSVFHFKCSIIVFHSILFLQF